MISIDGSYGEGGGQVLRTSLTMSLVTCKPFQINNLRSRRKKPGLLRQHLTAVNAAAQISRAIVVGNEFKSPELLFEPGNVAPGSYKFDIGSAGSCILVLQTILPALINAEGKSDISVKGGTHNPFAPTFDYFDRVFLSLLNQMGPQVKAELIRPGYYPAGGGEISIAVKPCKRLSPLFILDRGKVLKKIARAIVSRLPREIAHRELKVIKNRLSIEDKNLILIEETSSPGPGNVVSIEVVSEFITEIFTSFGEKRLRAEIVGEKAAFEAKEYMQGNAPVAKNLADQLLIPLVLAGGGKFRTLPLTEHAKTNIEIIKKFVEIDIAVTEIDERCVEVDIKGSDII